MEQSAPRPSSGMRAIFAAIRALEDQWVLPSIVLPLHRRIAGGGRGGMVHRTTPHTHVWISCGVSLKSPTKNSLRPSLSCLESWALGLGSWTCFLRVSEMATIRHRDVEQVGLTFARSKTKQPRWHRRPLARYPGVWVKWLCDYAVTDSVPWHTPFAGGDSALERALADHVKGSYWTEFVWHCFRRGGAGVVCGHKSNLTFQGPCDWWKVEFHDSEGAEFFTKMVNKKIKYKGIVLQVFPWVFSCCVDQVWD